MNDIDWNLLKSFVFVVKEGSLSAAARKLGSSQPTIGRHICALEDKLGLTLFTRSREGLSPNKKALDLFKDAEAMLSSISSLSKKVFSDEPNTKGVLRIGASEVVAVYVLPNIIKGFSSQYPEIQIEVVVSNKNESLFKREVDLAVRMIEPLQKSLIAKLVGKVNIKLYAQNHLLEHLGAPKNLEDLSRYKLIGPDRELEYLKYFSPIFQLNNVESNRFFYRTDNQILATALVCAGAGIGGVQEPVAKSIEGLIAILPDKVKWSMDYWLVRHEGSNTDPIINLGFEYFYHQLGIYIKKDKVKK